MPQIQKRLNVYQNEMELWCPIYLTTYQTIYTKGLPDMLPNTSIDNNKAHVELVGVNDLYS